jgi:hypothetical protein
MSPVKSTSHSIETSQSRSQNSDEPGTGTASRLNDQSKTAFQAEYRLFLGITETSLACDWQPVTRWRMVPVMITMIRIAVLFIALAISPLVPAFEAAAKDKQPIVIELYTSQGCSSCPPADKFMGELIKRDDILGLTFHVDYWDYIGWKDPFARPENTARQKDLSSRLGLRHIYTPQMIIHGAVNAVGSSEWDVERAIKHTKNYPQTPVKLTHNKGSQLNISIPASATKEPAKIYIIAYDDVHTTSIKRGENSGRKLSYFNVVRDMKHVGDWSGEAVSLNVPLTGMMASGRSACAVIIQSERSGHILGAAEIRLNHPS